MSLPLLALASAGANAAETKFEAYGETSVRYDSNLFRADSNADLPVIDGKTTRDEVIIINTAGVKGEYLYSQQALRGNIEGKHYEYLNVNSFDHYEYSVAGAYDYMILGRVGGTIDYQEARRQSQFADRNDGAIATQLNFDSDRSGGGSTNFLVANDVRLTGGYHLHSLRTPVLGAPSLHLTDQTALGQIDYLGISQITAGLQGVYINGRYSGNDRSNTYVQYGGGFAVAYDASALTKVNAAVSYTVRDDTGLDSTSGFTGDLTFLREFTPKTNGSLGLFRRIMSFTAGDNTVVETGGGLGLTWQTTEKFGIFFRYEYTHVAFQNQGVVGGAFDANRRDNFSGFLVTFTYRPLTWLEVYTAASYQTRKSSQDNNDFNAGVHTFRIRATF